MGAGGHDEDVGMQGPSRGRPCPETPPACQRGLRAPHVDTHKYTVALRQGDADEDDGGVSPPPPLQKVHAATPLPHLAAHAQVVLGKEDADEDRIPPSPPLQYVHATAPLLTWPLMHK